MTFATPRTFSFFCPIPGLPPIWQDSGRRGTNQDTRRDEGTGAGDRERDEQAGRGGWGERWRSSPGSPSSCSLGKGVNGYLISGMKQVVPNGIFLQGIVLGALNGLLAMGLVLIYRTNRIINFAQGELGRVRRHARRLSSCSASTGRSTSPCSSAWPPPSCSSALVEFAGHPALRQGAAADPHRRHHRRRPDPRRRRADLRRLLNKDAARSQPFKTPLSFAVQVRQGRLHRRPPLRARRHAARDRRAGVVPAAAPATASPPAPRPRTATAPACSACGSSGCRSIVWVDRRLPLGARPPSSRRRSPASSSAPSAASRLLMRALAAAVIGRMESLPITFGAAVLLTHRPADRCSSAPARRAPTTGSCSLVIIVALLVQRRRIGRLDGGSSTLAGGAGGARRADRAARASPRCAGARWGLAAARPRAVHPCCRSSSRPATPASSSVIMLYGMVGISLVILTGWSGNVSLGHWAIVGVGALVAQKLAHGRRTRRTSSSILLVAGLAGAVVAVVIGLPALRIQGLFLGVTTLALRAGRRQLDLHVGQSSTPNGAIVPRRCSSACSTSRGERALLLRLLRRARCSALWRSAATCATPASAACSSPCATTRRARRRSACRSSHDQAGRLRRLRLHGGRRPARCTPTTSSSCGPTASRPRCRCSSSRWSSSAAWARSAAPCSAPSYVRGTQYFLPAQFQLLVTGFGMLCCCWSSPAASARSCTRLRDRYLRWVADRRGVLVPSLVADRRVVDDEILEHVEEEPPPILDDEPELVKT